MRPTPLAKLSALAALAGACLGCGRESAAPPAFPYDRLYSSAPVVVAPGRRWEPLPDGRGWTFGGHATLAVHVPGPPPPSFAVWLVPDRDTVSNVFRAYWDGEELPGSPWAATSAGLELRVPAERLTPGTHRLRVARVRLGRGRGLDDAFLALRVGTGEGWTELSTDGLPHLRRLGDFLLLGVTGPGGRRRQSGFLFHGPQRAAVPLAGAAGGTLEVDAVNLSPATARFTAAAGGSEAAARVAAGGRARLALPLARGAAEVSFAAAGRDGGLFFWGAPRIVPPERDRPGRRPRPWATRRLPPVVLVTLDTTRRDALSPYGAPPRLTPNLHRLAGRATVYERAYSTAPWTLPSHASMFTGLYPSRHRAGAVEDRLSLLSTTLAELLRGRGYHTAGLAGGALCGFRFGVAQGFSWYRDPDRFETRGDTLTGYAEDVLEASRGLPLFLFVNYFDPHATYRAPRPYAELLEVGRHRAALAHLPVWRRAARGDIGAFVEATEGGAPPPPEGLAWLRAAYLAEVSFLDAQVGRLVAALKRHGLFDEALIVVMADHGELLGEGGRFSHAFRLDPELTEVPLLVKWPRQRRGARSRELVSAVDLFPTILKAAGLDPPPSDGLPLQDLGELGGRRPAVFFEEHESIVHALVRPRPGYERELYGIQGRRSRRVLWPDGEECAGLKGGRWVEEACRGARETLLARVRQALEAAGAGEPISPELIGAEDRARLEALGYL